VNPAPEGSQDHNPRTSDPGPAPASPLQAGSYALKIKRLPLNGKKGCSAFLPVRMRQAMKGIYIAAAAAATLVPLVLFLRIFCVAATPTTALHQAPTLRYAATGYGRIRPADRGDLPSRSVRLSRGFAPRAARLFDGCPLRPEGTSRPSLDACASGPRQRSTRLPARSCLGVLGGQLDQPGKVSSMNREDPPTRLDRRRRGAS
jgi:hypothetical protein